MICPNCGHSFPLTASAIHWSSSGGPCAHCDVRVRDAARLTDKLDNVTCAKCRRAALRDIERRAGQTAMKNAKERFGWP